jgi:arylsulfatase A-like enzyme
MTDQQMARAMSCVGHGVVKTPNLDRLAGRGMLFSSAYCASPVCGPSRAAIFSGLYPSASGATGNPGVYKVPVRELPDVMREAGYHTALVGKLHLGPIEGDHGFAEKHLHDAGYSTYHENEPANSDYVRWLANRRFGGNVAEVVKRFNADETALGSSSDGNMRFIMGSDWRTLEEHCNTWVTDRSIEVIRREASRRGKAPFFLFASYFGPHQPFKVPEPWGSMYDPNTIPLPPEFSTPTDDKPIASQKVASSFLMKNPLTERQYREALAAYYGQISMIDAGVGRILDELEAQGLAGNTLVVFTSDHGDHAGQFGLFFKSTMYENAARVPLIVAGPGVPAGTRCDRLVNNMDLYATLLERAGADPGVTHSRSLNGLLSGTSEGWDNWTYSEQGDWRMVARDNLKLISGKVGGATLYELYNRTTEVPDSVNLFGQADYAEKKEELLKLLEAASTRFAATGAVVQAAK